MISDIATQGTGMLAMFVNLDPRWVDDFRIWLKEDMFTARMDIGFRACASYDLLSETDDKSLNPAFLTVYETASLGVLYSEPYQALRRNRDTKDAAFHQRFLDAERYILSWVGQELSAGTPGFLPFVYVDRFDLTTKNVQKFNQWFIDEYLPGCEGIESLVRLRRYTTIEGNRKVFVFHEFDDISAINDKAWNKLRGNKVWKNVASDPGRSAAYRRVISET